MPAANIQMHFKLHFIMEANTMIPDQTAPLRCSLIRVHIVCIIAYQVHNEICLFD